MKLIDDSVYLELAWEDNVLQVPVTKEQCQGIKGLVVRGSGDLNNEESTQKPITTGSGKTFVGE